MISKQNLKKLLLLIIIYSQISFIPFILAKTPTVGKNYTVTSTFAILKQDTSGVNIPDKKKSKNIMENPYFSISSSVIYSSSSNIRDNYIFPGINFNFEVLYHITWPSDSLGFGFKTSFNRINFDDTFTISKLIFIDFHLLFLNTWGELYNVPIMFQPYIGYTLVYGNDLNHKMFFSYGGRFNFNPSSWKHFGIVIDGQFISTKYSGDPFSGSLGMVYFGVKYRF